MPQLQAAGPWGKFKNSVSSRWDNLSIKRQCQIRSGILMAFLEFWRITYFDKIVLALGILFVIFWNLRDGDGRHGEASAYSVFNRGGQHLAGEFRAEQFEAQLRGQRGQVQTNEYTGPELEGERPDGMRYDLINLFLIEIRGWDFC